MSEADPFDVTRALGAAGALREFNAAGVLDAADVHVAARLAALAGEADETVVLATALAVRAPRMGHVHVDLRTIRDTVSVDTDEPVDLSGLPWPDDGWTERVAASPLLAAGAASPLRLDAGRLYLDRYWREERRVARELMALAAARPRVDEARLDAGLDRLFPPGADPRQRLAAATAVRRRLAVVAGGPGTGKTSTVARIVALLAEQGGAPLIALAAPTGKAATRLAETVHAQARALPLGDDVRARLLGLDATTLHRLLGWRPDVRRRFRYGPGERLPHHAVIVDETSMVSLSWMARVVAAIRPDARLILVGDPGQLASIEAGAVLGDIVGPGDADWTIVLDHVYRHGHGIARLARAIREGDADAAVAALEAAPSEITWVREGIEAAIRAEAVAAGTAVAEAARAGDARAALAGLGRFALLCPHRRGPYGVATWTERIEAWLGVDPRERWYAGRPLLVTENDHELRLYNGDTGVVVNRGPDRDTAVFDRGGEPLELSRHRLGPVDSAYALTIHKSQGSQFATAAVLLPDPDARILTRELLYTAVTRAQGRLILAGSEAAVRAAVGRPIARASGLRDRLLKWRDPRNGGSPV